MRCERNETRCLLQQGVETALAGTPASGLAIWRALQAWRASWRPEPDPARSVAELSVIYLRAMRLGYAAYGGGNALPELFARESGLADQWQKGFAMAYLEAAMGLRCASMCSDE
ncbi:MAG: hypothetical protein K2X55_12735 [Burkholderiaceae bacterium]|nr:hypothetical protein [Burkholderiaceae bacterium]